MDPVQISVLQNLHPEVFYDGCSETTLPTLKSQLKLYSGEDGVDLESLERALTLVKKRSQAIESLKFRNISDDTAIDEMVALPVVRRKLEEVQIVNLKLTEEVERLENMLKLQTHINTDLHKELELLIRNRDKDKRELIERAEDFEQLAIKRLDKIHALEAQRNQFIYDVTKKRVASGLSHATGGPIIHDAIQANKMNSNFMNENDMESENILLNELIDEHGANLNPDENLLEVWVKKAILRDGTITTGSSTFVVIDFFDYESQTTSLLTGSKPEWDFAATFKIIVDDFLLRYLATDVITLELNMV